MDDSLVRDTKFGGVKVGDRVFTVQFGKGTVCEVRDIVQYGMITGKIIRVSPEISGDSENFDCRGYARVGVRHMQTLFKSFDDFKCYVNDDMYAFRRRAKNIL